MVFVVIPLILLAVIVILLSFPVDLKLDLSIDGQIKSKLSIFYFFRLGSWETGKDSDLPKKEKPDKEEAGNYSSLFRFYDVLQIDGLWNRLFLLLRRLKDKINIRNIDSEISVSLGDDYYTGMLAGLLLPLTLLLNNRVGNNINIQPSFEEDLIFKGYATAGLSFQPVNIIIPCLAFICSKPVRKAWKLLRK